MTSNHNSIPTLKFLFIILLMSQYGFFMLIPNAKITRALAFSPWLTLLVLVAMLLIESYSKYNDFKKYIVAFIGINIISFIGIIFQYKSIDLTAFSALGYASLCLIYFPVKKLAEKEDIYIIITRINVIAIIIIVIQVIFYNHYNQLLIHSIDIQKLEIRNGLRITYYDYIVMISLMISITRLFKEKKIIYIVNSLLSIFYIVYVSQTRFFEVLIVITILIQIIFHVVNDLKNGKIHYVFMMIVPIIFSFLGYVILKLYNNIMEPIFNGTYVGIGSYFARLGEITYYTDIIKINPFLGLGNFTSTSNTLLWNHLHGPLGIYYTQDIGLLGDIARLGMGILIIFIFLIRKILARKYFSYQNIGLFVLILGSVGSISIFVNGFIFGLVLALFSQKEVK